MQLSLDIIKHYADDILAVIGGEIFTFSITYNILHDMHWLDPTIKAIIWLVTGIIGGFGSLLGKDLYLWIKKKLFKK